MRYSLASFTTAILVVACGTGCSNQSNSKDTGVDKDTKVASAKPKDPANPEGTPKQPTKEEPVVQKPPVKEDPTKEEPKTEIPAKETPVKEPEKEKTPVKEVPVTDPPIKDKETAVKDPPPKETKTKEKEKDKGSKGTPTEPTEVGGKDFKHWMTKLKTSTDQGEREDALKAIYMFGPNTSYAAVPEIINQLNKTNIDLSVRVNGIVALSAILNQTWATKKEGPNPKDLTEAAKVYKRYLVDTQVIMRVRTLQGIPALGETSRGLVKDVIKLCKDFDTWEVRKEAIQTLVIIAGPDGKSPNAAEAIAQLKGGLGGINDSSYYVRQTAVQGLAVLCQKNGNVPIELYAVPEKGINDRREEVRLASLHALAALKGEFDGKTKPIVLARLRDRAAAEKNAILNIWIHASIMTIDKISAAHMDPITRRLNDEEATVKIQAMSAIANFADKAKPLALKPMLPLLDDKEPAVATTALIATTQIHHFEPVIAKLKDKSPEVRVHALQLISGMGKVAKKDCCDPVMEVVKLALTITANTGLAKEAMEQEVNVGEAAIATLVNLHCFETVPYLQNIAADKKVTKDLKEAAKDALEDFKKIQKELKEKK